MRDKSLRICPATAADLAAINELIERAVATWDLPARVKRLALPAYVYTPEDLDTLSLVGAYADAILVGVVAWEPAHGGRTPSLSLQGLYVEPQWWGRGVGTQLLIRAEQAARAQGFAALTVKAQPGARGFFLRHGFLPSDPADAGDYAHLLSKPLTPAASQ